MNNKHLSWYKEINNNFIIASRAYFLHNSVWSPEGFHNSLEGVSDVSRLWRWQKVRCKGLVDASFDTDPDDSKSQSGYILKVGAIS